MTPSYAKAVALVVLPPLGDGRLADRGLHRWLARADLGREKPAANVLGTVLGHLGRPLPATGQAALRYWGQTGERPTGWLAAADPVYLEAQLDTLRLFALEAAVEAADVRRLAAHLEATLGGASGFSFAAVTGCLYVTAQVPFATASVPPAALHGERPDEYLPRGAAVAAYRRLVSEIEMALHEHAVNRARAAAGHPPVNALWLWGGGTAPEPEAEPLPPLYADDPLTQGYWLSRSGQSAKWPGSIAGCLAGSPAGFVAVAPATDDPAELEALLAELRRALAARRLARLVLFFRDGVRAEVRRAHALRVWRRQHPVLDAGRPVAI